MVRKFFISVGMRGRKDCDVEADINRASSTIRKCYGETVILIDNWNCAAPNNAGRLWYLGEAVKKLGDCDACYFTKGWQNHKGCIAEMEICKIYGITIIEES